MTEILLGTETSEMRPAGSVGVGRGKAKAEDGTVLKGKSSWEREPQGGERREMTEAGRAVVETWEPCWSVRAASSGPWGPVE